MSIYKQNSRYFNCDDSNGLAQHNLTKEKYQYDTTVVLANEAGRLDLVSLRVYGTPINWWIIGRFNAILNPPQVQAGVILKIPKL